MGTPTWQRQLLQTLTRLDIGHRELREGMREVVAEIRILDVGQRELREGMREVVAEIRLLGDRMDNSLRITGEAKRGVEQRLERLERAVFPSDRT